MITLTTPKSSLKIIATLLFTTVILQCSQVFAANEELDPDVFNASYYVSRYADIATLSATEAQTHWQTVGVAENRQGAATFQASQYMSLYPAVATAVGSTNYLGAIKNYVTFGRGAGRIGVFALSPKVYNFSDYVYYNSDLPVMNVDTAKMHWLTTGISQGRRAHMLFAVKEYLTLYPSSLSYIDAINYYVQTGQAAGQVGLNALDPDIFNYATYTKYNPTLGLTSLTAAQQHWVETGINAGLQASPAYSNAEYLGQYQDLTNAYGATNYPQALKHFIASGRKEGRTGLYALSPSALSQYLNQFSNPTLSTLTTDRVQTFISKDGRTLRVVVKNPNNPSGPVKTLAPLTPGTSAYSYILNGIKDAKLANASLLVIPTGTYSIDPGTSGAPHVNLGGLADMTIDFQGSTLIFNGTTSGLQIIGSQRLNIKNATLDFNAQVAASAVITTNPIDGKKILVVDSAYPVPTGAQVKAVSLFNPSTKTWVQSPSNEIYFNSTNYPVYQGSQTFSSTLFNSFANGTTVLVRYRLYDAAAVYVSGRSTSDISFDNIKVYQSLGMGFNFYNTGRGFRLSGCSVTRNPSDPLRLISTPSDAIHFTNAGSDIIIENGDFAHQGDDGLNIASINTPVLSVETAASGNMSVAAKPTANVAEGDTLLFFNSGMGALGLSKVLSLGTTSAGDQSIVLQTPVNRLNTRSSFVNLTQTGYKYYIANNNFHDNRARALILQSGFGMVTNNILSNQTLQAVSFTADANRWFEGPGALNVVFSNNTINNSGWNGMGAVSIFSSLPTGNAHFASQQQITLSDNTFNNTAGPAIFVASARSVVIKNNVINNANTLKTKVNYGTTSTDASIVLTRAQSVSLTNNSRTGTSGPLGVDAQTTSSLTLQASY